MSQKLVVVIMGQNCERFIRMCLESVKEADAIVYCDGGSTDNTFEEIIDFENTSDYGKIDVIENPYNQEDKGMNGKQRNFYLEYVKDLYPDDWCLCLDVDEILSDNGIEKIKEFIDNV